MRTEMGNYIINNLGVPFFFFFFQFHAQPQDTTFYK